MNYREAAILVENRLGLPPSERLRILTHCVDAAIDLSRKLATEREFAAYVFTNPNSVTANLTAGSDSDYVDLRNLVNNSPYIFLDLLKFGNIYCDGIKANWIGTAQAKYQTSFQPGSPQLSLNGYFLNVLNCGSDVLSFEVPCLLDISTLPKPLETRFIDKAVELAAEIKSVVRPDYAQDGQK